MKHYLATRDWGSHVTLYKRSDGTLHLNAAAAQDPATGLVVESVSFKVETDGVRPFIQPVTDGEISAALGALEVL